MADYIDNEKLSREIVAFKEVRAKDPKAQVPDSITRDLFAIAEGVTNMHMFVKYTFREDMALDGVIICLRYVCNFDPAKGKPFSYFSRIVYRACQRRIMLERKQAAIKNAVMYDFLVVGCTDTQRSELGPVVNDMLGQLYDRIKHYEKRT